MEIAFNGNPSNKPAAGTLSRNRADEKPDQTNGDQVYFDIRTMTKIEVDSKNLRFKFGPCRFADGLRQLKPHPEVSGQNQAWRHAPHITHHTSHPGGVRNPSPLSGIERIFTSA
jgi:hypothetical protein